MTWGWQSQDMIWRFPADAYSLSNEYDALRFKAYINIEEKEPVI